MQHGLWKVGELARETGLSIRTLHYYDEIGLLQPSHKTDSGHRLYTLSDIERIQQVVSLKQLGFPLDEIRDMLNRPHFSPLRVIEMHLTRLREQVKLQQEICERLEAIARKLERSQDVTAEQFLKTIEVMNMFDKYFTKEQMEELSQRREMLGESRIREVEAEWPRLIAQVRAEMKKGTDPASPAVQEMARRWNGLVEEFTGGNLQTAKSVAQVYQNEPGVRQRTGIDEAMFEYISKAMAAANG
jgi:DNA-binding transcriptional MerR regulator